MQNKWIIKTDDALMKICSALSTFRSYKKGKTVVQVSKIALGLCCLQAISFVLHESHPARLIPNLTLYHALMLVLTIILGGKKFL